MYEAGVSISGEEAAAFLKTIDCYVLGSRTYEHALELGWPYGDTPAVVVTSREWSRARKSVEFYSGDLKTLVDVKLAPRYRNIWLVGGAMLSQRFLELGLVDEINLMIAPILLGEGLRLFGDPPLDIVRDLDIGVFSPIGINRTSRHMINLGCSLSCRNTD